MTGDDEAERFNRRFFLGAHSATSVQGWLRRETANDDPNEIRLWRELKARYRRKRFHVWRAD